MAKSTYKEMFEPSDKIVINNSMNSLVKFARLVSTREIYNESILNCLHGNDNEECFLLYINSSGTFKVVISSVLKSSNKHF